MEPDYHTFQFLLAFHLVHARVITELIIIILILIWWVQRDHCALRKSDARTYYYLQIYAIYLNKEIPWLPLVPSPAGITAAPDKCTLTSVTEDISTARSHTRLSQPNRRKKGGSSSISPHLCKNAWSRPVFWDSLVETYQPARQKRHKYSSPEKRGHSGALASPSPSLQLHHR